MTDTVTLPRSVVEQALHAIKYSSACVSKQLTTQTKHDYALGLLAEANDALRAALEQPQDHHEQHLGMVPAGWKLVPVEPTRDMLTTWIKAPVVSNTTAPGLYRAMLAAAPQPPVVEQPQGEQEPAPNGATHRQPKQGAFYKRVDGKWYVWSRMENGEPHRWYISPGTSESCLEPLNAAAPQPPAVKDSLTAEQPQSVTDCHQSQPVAWILRDANNQKVWFLEKTSTPTGHRGEWIKTPLYTHPQPPRQPLTDEEVQQIWRKWVGTDRPNYSFARAIERAYGIGGEA